MIRKSLPYGLGSHVTQTATHHLNINDVVLVALTAHGNRIAEAVHAPELKSANDLSQTKWKLWRLMEVFGTEVNTGNPGNKGGETVFDQNRLIWTEENRL